MNTIHPAAAATLALRFHAKTICCPKRLIRRPQELCSARKAKRQQQMFSVRKRSDSNRCFICAKAKRQQQMFYFPFL
ncbi:hypothetical protein [Bacillus sp. RS11]|uniref:hypothetical protein n=1 Tax=Lysinibacillus sp. RS11 TaxID=3242682 RepID=UPI0035C7313C